MLEDHILTLENHIQHLMLIPFIWLVLIAFALTLIENIFPPSPSDMIILAIAVITGMVNQSIIPIIISSTLGSIIGFWIMFELGSKFENKVIDTNKIKFISHKSIENVENLFRKWGFKLVVANRFMSGTRAVISFFAGMSGLPLTKTLVLSGVSSFLWYGILSTAGYYFGNDWRTLVEYLEFYETAVLIMISAVIIIALIIWLTKKRKVKE